MSVANRPAGAAARQVMTLVTGTGLAQLIPLAVSPLLTRLYTPHDFGVFALYASLLAVLAVLGSARYELALMLPKDDTDALALVALAMAIVLAASAVVLAAVLLFQAGLARWLDSPALGPWLFLVPVSMLLTGLVNTLTVWANRTSSYRQISISRVLQSASAAAVAVALGWGLSRGSEAGVGLVVGAVVGQALAGASLAWPFWRRWGARLQGVGWQPMRAQALRFREFPAINMPHALLDALQGSAVVALIAALFGPTLLGFHALAQRVVRTPMATLGSAVAQVFQKRAADALHAGGDTRRLVDAVLRRLGAAAVAVLPLLWFAPELFAFVFGAAWREAGVYAQILTPWLLLNFMLSPLSQLPLLLGRQARALAYGVAYQLAMVGPLAVAWLMALSLRQALLLQSVAASVVLVAYGGWLYRLSKSTARHAPA